MENKELNELTSWIFSEVNKQDEIMKKVENLPKMEMYDRENFSEWRKAAITKIAFQKVYGKIFDLIHK